MSNLPQRVGNYVLEREIGRGATSEVWLARHAHLEQRQVAIKILMNQDRETIQRFAREASLASRLVHPNIVQVYDYGYYHPFHCTVMQYVHGGSLRQILDKQHRLELQDALSIFKQIAMALDYAHSLDIIHRDISPGNVLVEQATGRAFLTDFGIARAPSQTITVDSSIMGTPGYWSPEHAHSATAVTHLSDIYSLGVVLYVMLSGDLPWQEAPGLPDRSFGPLLPLKQRGVHNLPGDVDRIFQTMLAIDPVKRFPSAQAAVDELERILARHHVATQIVTPLPAQAGNGEGTTTYQYQADGVAQNAIETVLGPDLIRAPIAAAHQRADELRDPAVVARLLNDWSQQGRLRRAFLGRMARLHKVSSRNVYFYRLQVLYEQRGQSQSLEEPDYEAKPIPLEPELDRWQVKLPPAQTFEDDPGGQVVLPGSARVVSCKVCNGKGKTICPRCKGKLRIPENRKLDPAPTGASDLVTEQGNVVATVSSATSASGAAKAAHTEHVLVPCPDCEGRGGFTCECCAGVGRLMQRQAFLWQRQATVFESNDDLPNLDERWLSRTCAPHEIYSERSDNGCRPEWSQAPVLSELVQQAVNTTDADTRIVLSQLTVSLIPVTDIVFDLGQDDGDQDEEGLYRLSIYGFENVIPPDWRFLNWERVIFVCATAFLFVVVGILGYFAFTG